MKTGIEQIAEQRNDQLQKLGYDLKHDIELNNDFQLLEAAGILTWLNKKDYGYNIEATCPAGWNEDLWHKMMTKPYRERLAIAGALLAAEIDRLQAIMFDD